MHIMMRSRISYSQNESFYAFPLLAFTVPHTIHIGSRNFDVMLNLHVVLQVIHVFKNSTTRYTDRMSQTTSVPAALQFSSQILIFISPNTLPSPISLPRQVPTLLPQNHPNTNIRNTPLQSCMFRGKNK